MTIHRSQGSEYPAVVILITTSAWMMLLRNLLYTAITRGGEARRSLRFPTGPGGAAVRTVSAGRRHSALNHRLQTR